MTPKTTPSIMKTCSSCGLQKPLSAFLQLSESEGTVYGNICANCRKSDAEKKHKDSEEGTRRQVGGSRIGADERVTSEEEKQRLRQEVDEQYHHDRDENQVRQSELSEKGRALAQDEKKRKESFLDANRTVTEATKQNKWQEILNETVAVQEQETKNAEKDVGISGKAKYVQSPIHQQFLDWIKGSPLAQAAERAKVQLGVASNKPATSTANKKTTLSTTTFVTANKAETKVAPPASKEINQTAKPVTNKTVTEAKPNTQTTENKQAAKSDTKPTEPTKQQPAFTDWRKPPAQVSRTLFNKTEPAAESKPASLTEIAQKKWGPRSR